MRVAITGESSNFSDLLIKLGDGKVAENVDIGEHMVKLPEDFFIETNRGDHLVEAIFPDFHENYNNVAWVKNRAIL